MSMLILDNTRGVKLGADLAQMINQSVVQQNMQLRDIATKSQMWKARMMAENNMKLYQMAYGSKDIEGMSRAGANMNDAYNVYDRTTNLIKADDPTLNHHLDNYMGEGQTATPVDNPSQQLQQFQQLMNTQNNNQIQNNIGAPTASQYFNDEEDDMMF